MTPAAHPARGLHGCTLSLDDLRLAETSAGPGPAGDAAADLVLRAPAIGTRIGGAGEDAADLPTGRRLSPGATLGVGATGRVLAVHDANLDRDVAMKVLHGDARAQPGSVARFVAEARIASSLAHPNVLPIYDLDTDDDGHVYFTMQRIAGRSLGVAIQASSPAARDPRIASFSQVTSIFVGVAQAVAYAHHRGIVHQDIKPDNIMLGDFGEVLLVDWGCATRRDTGTATRLYGTPLYMSPEQARREHVDERSDIYCLGAALLHALTLRCPTWSVDEAEFWRRKQAGEIDAPTADELRRVPPPVIDIALKALQARPAQRYATADALLDDLRRYQAGLATVAHRDTVLESLARFHRRHAQVLWTAAAAVAIIAVLGALLVAELAKGVVRWGAPVVSEEFADDAWRERWSTFAGDFRRADGRIVSSGPRDSILVCDRRFSGATAIEYDAEILPDSEPCDISLIWCRDLVRDAGGTITGLESRYECKVGAFDGTYTAIRVGERNLDFSDFRPVRGAIHHVRVEIEDDLMTMAVDGREICRWRDPLPFGGGYVALLGYYPGKAYDNVRIYSRGLPERLSPLAIGDAYAQDGLWDQAALQYRRVADDHAGRALADEAIYRQGLCLLRGGQRGPAHDAWRAIDSDRRVREHRIDALVEDGAHDAALAAMTDLARDATGEQRKSLALNWSGFANDLIRRGDLDALARYVAFHDRHLHGLMIADHLAAEALLALRRYEEVLARYPRHRDSCCRALQALQRHHEVLVDYPEQRWAAAYSALMSGEYEYPEIAAYRFLHALALCRSGRAAECLERYGADDWCASLALRFLGRLDEAIVRSAEIHDAREIAHLLAGRDDGITHPDLVVLAALLRGRLEPALASDRHHASAETIRLIDRLASGALSGGGGPAALGAKDDPRAFDAVMHDEWRLRGVVRPALRALLDDGWRDFDRSLEAIDQPRHRYADAQQAWHWAARLLGRIDDQRFLAQPNRAFAAADLLLIHALLAERDGRREEARAQWRAWLEMPWCRRAERPDPLWLAFARWRAGGDDPDGAAEAPGR